ncbi:hypothetical protein ADP71_17000 [Vitreoscilla sp. C1]|uniref:N-acetylmuramidase domain-containing protein n=1 Tax=Vitreoscilla sp. (strain C1) TaxID=96942 RepID=UPI000CDBD245|nr:N-acetylmuramidase domain-containing protein [Vitreoscilla sp. C1]AUZ05227.1 hypothetical protein ADP71_17000 [Vitreoscilla sp. C1]
MQQITLTAQEAERAKDLNVAWMQKWLNVHGAYPALAVDGDGGSLTRAAIIQVFTNKHAMPILEYQLQTIAEQLGDTNTQRIKAVATVESGTYGGWFASGLPVILYERHKFWEWVQDKSKRVLSWFSNPKAGDYTMDANNNGINDSWEKLSYAACKDPLAAFQAISIGKFQVLGRWYRECGYNHPIEMLWAARNSELAHYEMLRDYILKVANLKGAFLRISSHPEDCRAFAKGYNGPAYEKYAYHTKIAKEMR